MKTQITNTGVWEAQDGYAVFWDRTQGRGSEWQVDRDLVVRHTDGPDSPAPPMHIRRSAISQAA